MVAASQSEWKQAVQPIRQLSMPEAVRQGDPKLRSGYFRDPVNHLGK